MTDEEWDQGWVRALGVRLGGKALVELDEHGRRLVDDDFVFLVNGSEVMIPFTIPAVNGDEQLEVVVDTTTDKLPAKRSATIPTGQSLDLQPRSLILLRGNHPAS